MLRIAAFVASCTAAVLSLYVAPSYYPPIDVLWMRGASALLTLASLFAAICDG